MISGAFTTLRSARMYAFFTKLVNVTLPQVRDFRGLSRTKFDGNGNYNFGFFDQLSFPEILYDDVIRAIGFNITIATTAKRDNDGYLLLKPLSFPFNRDTITI